MYDFYQCGNSSCTMCHPQTSSLKMDSYDYKKYIWPDLPEQSVPVSMPTYGSSTLYAVRSEMRLLLTTFPEATPVLRAAIVDGRIVGGAWGGMSPSGFVGCIIGWIEHVYSGGNRRISWRASYEARSMGRTIIAFVDTPTPIRRGATPTSEPRLQFLLDIITELEAEQEARAFRDREIGASVFLETSTLPEEEYTSPIIPPWMQSVLATLPDTVEDRPPVTERELCPV